MLYVHLPTAEKKIPPTPPLVFLCPCSAALLLLALPRPFVNLILYGRVKKYTHVCETRAACTDYHYLAYAITGSKLPLVVPCNESRYFRLLSKHVTA